jgi:hypothetical protein
VSERRHNAKIHCADFTNSCGAERGARNAERGTRIADSTASGCGQEIGIGGRAPKRTRRRPSLKLWRALALSLALSQSWPRSGSRPCASNLRWRSGDRAGRARLSETAGSPATHSPLRPNAFASRDGSRPNTVQLRPRSCGLRETRPTCAVARYYQKSCVSSVSDATLS